MFRVSCCGFKANPKAEQRIEFEAVDIPSPLLLRERAGAMGIRAAAEKRADNS